MMNAYIFTLVVGMTKRIIGFGLEVFVAIHASDLV